MTVLPYDQDQTKREEEQCGAGNLSNLGVLGRSVDFEEHFGTLECVVRFEDS